jgi:phospholipid/cholesterol/gamma-HCH transport system substrate-binding protein
MNRSRLEWKVGFFVVICLVLLAALVVLFNKGLSFKPTYALRLKATNVGQLMPKASVLMAGVRIGSVSRIELDPGGKTVSITLEILDQYRIHRDARFVIDQIGFLGDQFVSVIAAENKAPVLAAGEEVRVEEPFNLQEAARSASGLIQRVDKTVQNIDNTVSRVDEMLLSDATFTNLTATVSNFRQVSDRALIAINAFDQIVQSNAAPVSFTVSNLAAFSTGLGQLAMDLGDLVGTNRAKINLAVRNLGSASASVTNLLGDLEAGKGLAGFLLKDDSVKQQLSLVASNLTILSSNLNKYGLLYKPKKVKNPASSPSLYPGRNP